MRTLLLVLSAMLGLAVGAMPAVAQEKAPAAKSGKDAPGGLPRKDARKPAASADKPGAAAGMEMKPAPKTGSMPGSQTPAPKGRLGTEPTHKGKLGTPPPKDSKDRPPRPQ
jgi:translation initiation factor IF-2